MHIALSVIGVFVIVRVVVWTIVWIIPLVTDLWVEDLEEIENIPEGVLHVNWTGISSFGRDCCNESKHNNPQVKTGSDDFSATTSIGDSTLENELIILIRALISGIYVEDMTGAASDTLILFVHIYPVGYSAAI